jgi:hypothetical protein
MVIVQSPIRGSLSESALGVRVEMIFNRELISRRAVPVDDRPTASRLEPTGGRL